MKKLKTYKFNELYQMNSGISSKPEQAGHGSPFVSFSTVFNNYFLPDELPDLMDISDKEKEIYSVWKGDIFLTRTSETLDELGMSCVAIKDYPASSFSGFLKRLRPTQKDITYDKYMAFYLRSKLFRKTMNNNAIMTLRASLNETIFTYLDLVLPTYYEQKKIGDLLFTINEKIKLNNRINTELEAMAKTLYDYWFVQFDFPNEEGKPYKSSGSKMVFNAKLKKEIPVGWESGTINDIADLVRGVSYNKDDIKSKNDNGIIPILRATNITGNVIDLENMVYVSEEFANEQQLLNKFDILITMSSGSKEHIGKNGFYYFDDKVAFGAFCAKLVGKKNYRFYLYSYTQSEFMSATIKNECLGTNINNLNGSLVKGFKLPIPSNKILEKFNKSVSKLYEQIANNTKQSQQLASFRDWLLPMLMNGQVTIKEAGEKLDNLDMAAEPEVTYSKTLEVDFQTKECAPIERAILAAYIVKRIGYEQIGRTKLMKLLHLTEYHCRINSNSHFVKKTAGPYDGKLIKDVEQYFQQFRLFITQKVKKDNITEVHYLPSLEFDSIDDLFIERFEKEVVRINHLLGMMKNWELKHCEVISTLYAVWNNRIINQKSTEEHFLEQDFLQWSKRKKKYNKDNIVKKSLQWMRKNEIVPSGWGDLIEKEN